MPARISDSDKKIFIETPPEKWTYTFITSLIGDHYDVVKNKVVPSKYTPQDIMILNANEYFNKEKVETTLGSFIFNKVVIEQSGVKDVTGYVNEVINKGVQKKLYSICTNARLDNVIDSKTLIKFLNLFENLGMRMNAELASSITPKTFKPLPNVVAKRDELFKKYEKELNKGDITKMVDIEQELIGLAKDTLKDDPGMMLYNSKANASFENNYKNMFITKGAVFDPATGTNKIIKNSFSEGLTKKNIPALATEIVSGAYPKAVDTAVSGYMSKRLLAFMQSTTVSDVEDCGSKGTLLTTIDDPVEYRFRWIIDNGKYVQLNNKNIGQYMNKTYPMRSPMFCAHRKICKRCIGGMPEKMNIKNIGLTCTIITGRFTNMSMKKFHDNTIKLFTVDPRDLLICIKHGGTHKPQVQKEMKK